MKNNKVILFDLGRVLFDFDHMIAARRMQKFCTFSDQELYNLFFDSALTDLYERGRISSHEFYQRVKDQIRADISYELFASLWSEIFTPKQDMFELLQLLRNDFELYLVSNVNELHFSHLKKHFPQYFKFFRHMFLSYELGMRKPDREIYEHIIKHIQKPPSSIVYVDDRVELIEPAQALGIDAFVFTDSNALREELKKRDVVLGKYYDSDIAKTKQQ